MGKSTCKYVVNAYGNQCQSKEELTRWMQIKSEFGVSN